MSKVPVIRYKKKKAMVEALRRELVPGTVVPCSTETVTSSRRLTSGEGSACADVSGVPSSKKVPTYPLSGERRAVVKRYMNSGSPHLRMKRTNIERAKQYGFPVGESRAAPLGTVRYSVARGESEKRATAVVRKGLFKPFRG